jgi:hypothetical protein
MGSARVNIKPPSMDDTHGPGKSHSRFSEALNPFIKTREEAAAIRRGLQQYLGNHLESNDTSLNLLNVPDIRQISSESPPSALSAVRGAYWRALKAQSVAQAKHDALQADIEQLKRKQASFGVNADNSSGATGEEYLGLLRQRERHRKLTVIDRALSQMSTNTDRTSSSFDDVVKGHVGEIPAPPSTQPSISRDPEVEANVIELKKAVISTKRLINQHKISSATNEEQNVPPEVEVAGLQKALQELTMWMEDQLTTIAETEPEQQSSKDPVQNGDKESHASVEDIEVLYGRYLETRQRLVRNVNHGTQTDAAAHDEEWLAELSNPRTTSSHLPPTKTPATVTVPFIPKLLAVKADEQSFFQQSAYLRRQLSDSESGRARLIERLADESHLVQPGASQGIDWANAVATDTTEESVLQRLEIGKTYTSSATETHDAIKWLPSSLQRLSD